MKVIINPFRRSVSIDDVEVIQKIVPFPKHLDHLASVSCEVTQVDGTDSNTLEITNVKGVYRHVSHLVQKEYYYKHLPAFIDWYKEEQQAQTNKENTYEGNIHQIVDDYLKDYIGSLQQYFIDNGIKSFTYDISSTSLKFEKGNSEVLVVKLPTASDSVLGLVRGTTNELGSVAINTDGTMSVTGWSNLLTHIASRNGLNSYYNTTQNIINANTNYTVPEFVVGAKGLLVFVNGKLQFLGDDYIEVGNTGSISTTITFTSNIASSSNVVVVSFYQEFDDAITHPISVPVANAGVDTSYYEQDQVTLYGQASGGSGQPYTYKWEQIAGIAVAIADSTQATMTFTAPTVHSDSVLKFQLVVIDSDGIWSMPSIVSVTVKAVTGIPNTVWYYDQPTADIFTIETADDLAGLAVLVNTGVNDFQGKTVNLGRSIDLSKYGKQYVQTAYKDGWIAIGTSQLPFKGTFSGTGHKISSLYINNTLGIQGLFGKVSEGNIANLQLDVDITAGVNSNSYIGSVVGIANSNTILTGCSVTGSVISKGSMVGGLIGSLEYSSVNNCNYTGLVRGEFTRVGGIVGSIQWSTVNSSYSLGDVVGSTDVGGIVGYLYGGTINTCYSNSNISGDYKEPYTYSTAIGGIVGQVLQVSTISNCYTTGTIRGNNCIGGIVGQLIGTQTWENNSVVTNCYTISTIIGIRSLDGTKGYWVGGIVGDAVTNGYTITKCFVGSNAINSNPTYADYVGRIAGQIRSDAGILVSPNVAFSNVTFSAPVTVVSNATGKWGLDTSAAQIIADGTLGGYFTADNGWTVANGQLPGLGTTVAMPTWIQ